MWVKEGAGLGKGLFVILKLDDSSPFSTAPFLSEHGCRKGREPRGKAEDRCMDSACASLSLHGLRMPNSVQFSFLARF